MKTIYITLSVFSLSLLSCSGTSQQLREAGTLDLKEVSGLEYVQGTLWALEDSGNDSNLYKLDEDGTTKGILSIENVTNIDWEDITSDKEGNLYIGDFGNNDNERRDLTIYKINRGDLTKEKANAASKTTFYYPEQTDFPPKKSSRIYDCEAFFEYEGNFYLFTKNRSSGFDGSLNVYKVPNKEGTHAAKLLGSLTTCSAYRKCAVTGADISPEGTNAVLLTGDKIFIITNVIEDIIEDNNMQMFELSHVSQKEGICFKDNDVLLIADEKDKKTGGMLYETTVSELKAKL